MVYGDGAMADGADGGRGSKEPVRNHTGIGKQLLLKTKRIDWPVHQIPSKRKLKPLLASLKFAWMFWEP